MTSIMSQGFYETTALLVTQEDLCNRPLSRPGKSFKFTVLGKLYPASSSCDLQVECMFPTPSSGLKDRMFSDFITNRTCNKVVGRLLGDVLESLRGKDV